MLAAAGFVTQATQTQLPCTFAAGPEALAGKPTCAAWLEPPLNFARILHPGISPQYLQVRTLHDVPIYIGMWPHQALEQAASIWLSRANYSPLFELTKALNIAVHSGHLQTGLDEYPGNLSWNLQDQMLRHVAMLLGTCLAEARLPVGGISKALPIP